jgi:hypothetical protein
MPQEGSMVRSSWWSSLPVALAVAASAAGGCTPNEISFFIVQSQVPVAGGSGTGCSITADLSALHRNEGTLDVWLRNNYAISPLFRSELIGYADPMAGRAETRGIFVEGAEVTLFVGSPTGSVYEPPYTVYFSSFLPPNTSQSPGLAVTSFELIRSDIGTRLRADVCHEGTPTAMCPVAPINETPLRLVAEILPFGRTMGGIRLNGARYRYGINVCCRCLISFPAESDDAMRMGPDCLGSGTVTQSCTPGQDDAVDCRTCAANCQPPTFAMTPGETCP